MRLLLDTHALIWFLTNNSRLSKRGQQAIADPGNEALASAVSGYEIVYKQRARQLDAQIGDELPIMLRRARIGVHPIDLETAIEAARLPGPHRDPWDRLLMAQARLGSMTVVTVDPVFRDYGIPVLW
jgi:PIN domain nuclease of toxin-antitoxin system